MRDPYGGDVLDGDWRQQQRRLVPVVLVETGMVLEEGSTGYTGEVVGHDSREVLLEGPSGATRVFGYGPGFLLEGEPVVLTAAVSKKATSPVISRSGSVTVTRHRARTALPSRIYVEGRHDAELVEKVWGHDLRVEGVVVEALEGADHLVGAVSEFQPAPGRRLGVLLDHIVPGSKESQIAAEVGRSRWSEHVLVVGHPFVDVWQGVRPQTLGLDGWPTVPRGVSWKAGVLDALGWDVPPGRAWSRILGSVDGIRDLEPSLSGRVEELIDFVASPPSD